MGRHCYASARHPRSIAASLAVLAALAVAGGITGTASAHNHVLNPSGACNANGGPGNADALTNPAGKTPGNRDNARHAIDVSEGQNNCANAR